MDSAAYRIHRSHWFVSKPQKKKKKTVKAANYQVMKLCTCTAFLTNGGNTFDANTHTFRFKRR